MTGRGAIAAAARRSDVHVDVLTDDVASHPVLPVEARGGLWVTASGRGTARPTHAAEGGDA